MTFLHTLPTPQILSHPAPHEHAWLVESRHRTSDGTVLYVRCTDCAMRRVDLQPHAQMPPTALSRDLPA